MKLAIKLLLVLFLSWPVFVSAHGNVTTRQQISGNYLIEFEYHTPGTIFAGEYVIYNIYLLRADNNQAVDFDVAFIRFEKKSAFTIAAANLAEDSSINGYTSMGNIIHESGNYSVEISFLKDGKQLAQTGFDFEVNPMKKANQRLVWSVFAFIIGLAVGTSFSWLRIRKKKR